MFSFSGLEQEWLQASPRGGWPACGARAWRGAGLVRPRFFFFVSCAFFSCAKERAAQSRVWGVGRGTNTHKHEHFLIVKKKTHSLQNTRTHAPARATSILFGHKHSHTSHTNKVLLRGLTNLLSVLFFFFHNTEGVQELLLALGPGLRLAPSPPVIAPPHFTNTHAEENARH